MGRPKKEKPNHGSVYEVKVTIGKSFDGSSIRKSFYSSISKADAKAKAEQYKVNQAVQDITGEITTPKKATTFSTWALKWLETYKRGVVKTHTYLYTYESNVKKYIIPFFQNAHLADIRQIDIQNYFNNVKNPDGTPLAKSTLDKQKMILKAIFDAAIDNDLCIKNPVKNIKYKNVSDKVEKHVYTKEQAQKVMRYAREIGEIGVCIMLETGIRRSELLGLQWSDIDTSQRVMHIQRAVVQTRGEILIDKPKTETSDRWIPLSTEFVLWIASLQHSGKYVIGTDEPQSPSTYAKSFSRFMRKVSAEEDVPVLSPHELRHTFGTLLRESGVDIYTIQRIMGHSDISVTASVYVHNDIDVLRRQMGIE